MKKRKTFIALLSALFALVFGAALFTACGQTGGGNSETYFNVTVVMENAPVANATVVFTRTDVEEEPHSFTTGEDGIAHVDLPRVNRDLYHVTVTSGIPDGYGMEEPEGYYTVNTGRNFTINIVPVVEEPKASYTVRVVAPAGANVSLQNRSVFYSKDGIQLGTAPLGTTDATGTLEVETPTEGFLVLGPVTGYNYNRNYSESSPYKLSPDGGEIIFRLIPSTVLANDKELMSAQEKDTFLKRIDNSPSFKETAMGEDGRDTRLYPLSIGAGEERFFTFQPKKSGLFVLYADHTPNCEVTILGESFSLDNNDFKTTLPENKAQGTSMNCNANRTYVFYVRTTAGAENIQLALVDPVFLNETHVEREGTYTLNILEKLPALLSFRPSRNGKYQATIETEGDFVIHQIYNRYATSPTAPTPDDQKNDNAISFNGIYEMNITDDVLYHTDSKGNIDKTQPSNTEWLLRIFTTNPEAEYPIEIRVRIKRLGDPDKGRETETTDVEEPKNLKQAPSFNENTHTLTPVGIYETDARVSKQPDANGYYHLNTLEGPVIYVKLRGHIDPYYTDVSFDSLDTSGSSPYRFNVTTREELDADPTAPYRFVSYSNLLRGYRGVNADGEPVMEGGYSEYYLKYVNDDGVYPLDSTLMEFLKLFAASNSNWLTSFGSSSIDSLWLFSSYYYDDGTPLPAPEPRGEGTKESPYLVNIGSYTVPVSGTTAYLKYTGEGTIVVSGENVTISSVGTDGTFTLTVASAGTYKIAVQYKPGTNVLNPIELTNTNDLTNIPTEGTWYSYRASQDGMYTFTLSNTAITAYATNGAIANLTNLLMKEGAVFTVRLAAEEGTQNATLNVERSEIQTLVPSNANEENAGTQALPYVIDETGLYGAVITADTKTVSYSIRTAGRYTVYSTDSNIRVQRGNNVYARDVYFSVIVEDNPVTFTISAVNGNADVLYFTVDNQYGYDANHPVTVTMTGDAVSGQVSVESVYNDTTQTYVGDHVYHSFTAPQDGLYLFTFSNGSASMDIAGDTRFVHEYLANIYRVVLKANETMSFSLTYTGSNFPVTYSYTITRESMPADGEKDAPKQVTGSSYEYSESMKKGEEYYFVIDNEDGYYISFTSDPAFTVYDLGSSSFNDDRRNASHVVTPNQELYKSEQYVPRRYFVVVANEDCNVTITFQ